MREPGRLVKLCKKHLSVCLHCSHEPNITALQPTKLQFFYRSTTRPLTTNNYDSICTKTLIINNDKTRSIFKRAYQCQCVFSTQPKLTYRCNNCRYIHVLKVELPFQFFLLATSSTYSWRSTTTSLRLLTAVITISSDGPTSFASYSQYVRLCSFSEEQK